MKEKNPNKPIDELLKQNTQSKANAVFQKLMAKNKAKPNSFDKIRETTYPFRKDIKSGVDEG